HARHSADPRPDAFLRHADLLLDVHHSGVLAVAVRAQSTGRRRRVVLLVYARPARATAAAPAGVLGDHDPGHVRRVALLLPLAGPVDLSVSVTVPVKGARQPAARPRRLRKAGQGLRRNGTAGFRLPAGGRP